ncbi:methyl-accepting chemotaxis protein [uncultured Selenomonas sp.]|uniref:methyl-accepting chemotaxis protein n=1 Tax=uncultured Selenomonas sp. TaxID=159275 RepID=UPI0028DC7EAB|nr:methyl-accepting chemotaxis protein [uncultured Selenomonas sp.]
MKLRSKLLLGVGIPFCLVFLAVSVFSYWNASTLLKEATQREMMVRAQLEAEQIVEIVDAQRYLLEGLTEAWSSGLPSIEAFAPVGKNFMKREGVNTLFIGFPDRDFLDSEEGVVPKSEFDATTREWYQSAAKNDGVQISSVYVDNFTKIKVMTLSKAMRQNGELLGVVAADIRFDAIEKKVAAIHMGETGAAFLLDADGHFIYHAQMKLEDRIQDEGAEKAKTYLSKEPLFFEGSFQGVDMFYAVQPVGDTGWNLIIFVPQQEVFANIATLKWTMLTCALFALALMGGILYAIAKSISSPIETLETIAAKVATGDLSTKLTPTDRQDEIGSLHNSFCRMTEGLQALIHQTAQTAEQLAASSEELTASADQSAQGAQQASAAIVKITDDTQEQTAVVNDSLEAVSDITKAMDQINAGVDDVSHAVERVEEATTEGQQGLVVAVDGMQVLDKSAKGVADAVTALYESSKRISEIVEMITNIAGQTNLLALNAAIEAARAGEQGRGFTVVAEEVRKLAEQSEHAAQEITALITDNSKRIEETFKVMQDQKDRVTEGVEQVHQASARFERIATVVKELSDKVSGILASTQQIHTQNVRMETSVQRLKSVSDSVQDEAENVSAVSQEQAASMQEIAASSSTLANIAQDLQKAVSKFHIS